MQEIRVRLPAEAINLLQFFKINLGNLLLILLIFQIDCVESPTTYHAIIISEINSFI